MSYDYSSIMQAQWERLEDEAREAANDLELSRRREDGERTMWAAERILQIDAQRTALAQRANQWAASQAAQPQRHPSGLSDTEIEIAKNSHSGGTVEERINEYVQNKHKLARMRMSGEYRDDQGRVTR